MHALADPTDLLGWALIAGGLALAVVTLAEIRWPWRRIDLLPRAYRGMEWPLGRVSLGWLRLQAPGLVQFHLGQMPRMPLRWGQVRLARMNLPQMSLKQPRRMDTAAQMLRLRAILVAGFAKVDLIAELHAQAIDRVEAADAALMQLLVDAGDVPHARLAVGASVDAIPDSIAA